MPEETRNGGHLSELVSGITTDAERLVHLNIELAKEETRELAIRNAIAVALLAVGALLIGLCVFVVLPVVIVLWVPNHLLAAAVWAGAYLLLGLILAIIGRLRLRLEPPRRTIESLKETKEWLVHQLRSSAR